MEVGGEKAKSFVSGFAVASFIMGILSYVHLFSLEKGFVAIIFGLLALSRLRKIPSFKGRGIAIAGILLGFGYLVVFVAVLLIKPGLIIGTFSR